MGAVGEKFALGDAPVGSQSGQPGMYDGYTESQPRRGFRCCERSVGAGVASQQITQRIGHGFNERQRNTHGQRNAKGIAQPRRILNGGVPLVTCHIDPQRAVRGEQPRKVRGRQRQMRLGHTLLLRRCLGAALRLGHTLLLRRCLGAALRHRLGLGHRLG